MYNYNDGKTYNELDVMKKLHDLFIESGVVLMPLDETKSIFNYFSECTKKESLYDFIIRYNGNDDYDSDLLNFMSL